MKWAKGGGERRESEREHDFSERKKKRKEGGSGRRPERSMQYRGEGQSFYTGSGTRKFCCRVARPSARSVCEARRSKRCKVPSGVSAGQRAARSCCKLSKSAPLHWRMCASSHRRTCLSRSTEERVAWEPAPAWQESATSRRCCRRSSTRGGGRRRNGQACKLRAHMSQQSGQRGAASGRR